MADATGRRCNAKGVSAHNGVQEAKKKRQEMEGEEDGREKEKEEDDEEKEKDTWKQGASIRKLVGS